MDHTHCWSRNDFHLLMQLTLNGIDTGRIQFTTHERDLFDGLHRTYIEEYE